MKSPQGTTQGDSPSIDISCDPESCKACGIGSFGGSHPDLGDEDDENSNVPPDNIDLQRRQSSRSPDSILQAQLTSPDSWPQGPDNWWGQLWAVIEHKGARSRHRSVRINDRMEEQGLSSADFSPFLTNPDVGGAGPIWGCTVVVVATDKGIWTSHHWEEPNFRLMHHRQKWPNANSDTEFQRQVLDFLSDGELREGTNRKQYLGLNDLRDYFISNREFIHVRIITPSLTDMGQEFYPDRVYALGEHLAGLLEIQVTDIKTFTYEKGHDPTGSSPPTGMVSWQYATLQQVRWSQGEWVFARVLRVRFEDEVVFQHVWCAPEAEGNTSDEPEIVRRQEPATTSKGDENAGQETWHWNPAYACRAAQSSAPGTTSAVFRSTTYEPHFPSIWSLQTGVTASQWFTLTLSRLSQTVTVRQGIATVTVWVDPTGRSHEPRAMSTEGPLSDRIE
ncbi:hypothetical protein ACHAQH_008658 [Verticillium albo-atrum]